MTDIAHRVVARHVQAVYTLKDVERTFLSLFKSILATHRNEMVRETAAALRDQAERIGVSPQSGTTYEVLAGTFVSAYIPAHPVDLADNFKAITKSLELDPVDFQALAKQLEERLTKAVERTFRDDNYKLETETRVGRAGLTVMLTLLEGSLPMGKVERVCVDETERTLDDLIPVSAARPVIEGDADARGKVWIHVLKQKSGW